MTGHCHSGGEPSTHTPPPQGRSPAPTIPRDHMSPPHWRTTDVSQIEPLRGCR